MNKFIKYGFLTLSLVMLMGLNGCKKFLNVEPVIKLSGNNFWKSEVDAETFTNNIYRLFRKATMSNAMYITGDVRCAPVKANGFPLRYDFDYLANNNIKTLLAADASRTRPGYDSYTEWYQARARYDLIPDWEPYFQVIQSCNIMEKEIDLIPAGNISEAIKNRYKAEAVFMRSISYYFLVRLFGDVPFYREAYQQKPLPRTNMVQVFNECVSDLAKVKDNLPWTYGDPASRAVRAMRGGALALMMHMKMWNAGFDNTNAKSYMEDAVSYAEEIEEIGWRKEGAYELLPIEKTYEVMYGRSKEGLFEIQLSDNYGESILDRRFKFSNGLVNSNFLPQNDRTYSEMQFTHNYIKKLYPEDVADRRKEIWFDNNMYKNDGSMQFFKMFNKNATTKSTDDNPIVFRLADVILLHAEALAELGTDNAKAEELLNIIRARAGADLYPAEPGEGKLKDAIFWERCKELMGEGHYFYDLVRTKKIMNSDFCYHTLSFSAFTNGAWTWPITKKALQNNPYMNLNNYWE